MRHGLVLQFAINGKTNIQGGILAARYDGASTALGTRGQHGR